MWGRGGGHDIPKYYFFALTIDVHNKYISSNKVNIMEIVDLTREKETNNKIVQKEYQNQQGDKHMYACLKIA